MDSDTTVLLIEPYYSGSHKMLIDMLHDHLSEKNTKVTLSTLPGKKWHWRARTSALYFAQTLPRMKKLKCIFTSCVLPLHELLGLRMDFQECKKVIYFHENQLVYPVRNTKERDFQYGYNQIMSCLAADVILFNSNFNKDSFLSGIKKFFKLQPDHRPKDLRAQVEPKCRVLYFPLKISCTVPAHNFELEKSKDDKILRLVWPHRWEFDKNPDMFFQVMIKLKESGTTNFRLIVLGESFTDNPPVFENARAQLQDMIEHFGYVPDKKDYYKLLAKSDMVLSTANHEFFGVSMLEAVSEHCFPLAPNNLVYPEIFQSRACLYDSDEDLLSKLQTYLSSPVLFAQEKQQFFNDFSLERFSWKKLEPEYSQVILETPVASCS